MSAEVICPVCGSNCSFLDAADFNKSCEEQHGKFLTPSGISISYYLCNNCSFCFAPEFSSWKLQDFQEKIYNQDYIEVDPDYLDIRPRSNAHNLISMFGDRGSRIKHLDFGGGNGLLSRVLNAAKWRSTSYDPFVDKDVVLDSLGKFDLITAFEVFEHVPDVNKLVKDISSLLKPDGIVLFSTLVSDGNIEPSKGIDWWYASPRNGHISLFSVKSLAILGAQLGFSFGSFSSGFHLYCKQVPLPSWASRLAGTS
jgi:SAM-dependent methyltransferase